MGAAINKKRKLKDEAAVEKVSKKSKKDKKEKRPAKVVEPPSEDDEDEDAEVSEEDKDVEAEAEEQDVEEEEEEDADVDVEDKDTEALVADSTHLLPPATDSDQFEDMKLSEKTMRAIKEMGFTKMTHIQKSVSFICPRYLAP